MQFGGEPQKTVLTIGNTKRVTTIWNDGREMVEEFDATTHALMTRRVKAAPNPLTGDGKWVWEVGQDQQREEKSDFIAVASTNPVFLRKDTPWRVRNIPYPEDNYEVLVDHEKQQIVIKTVNKKYYKRIDVPDLARVGLVLDEERLSWTHRQNTLIVSYTKPGKVLEREREALSGGFGR